MNNLSRCCVAIAILIVTAYCQAEPIRLVTHHLPPYQVVDEEGILGGNLVELVQCTLTVMDHAYQVDVRPLARAKKEFTAGKFDALFVLNQTNERDYFGVASAPIIETHRSLFSLHKLTMSLNSPEMKALQIGVLHGSTLQKWLLENGYTNLLPRYDYHVLFELLQLGRIDAILAPYEVLYEERGHGHVAKDIKIRHISDANLVNFFSFSWLKKHPQFLPKFNAALARCKQA